MHRASFRHPVLIILVVLLLSPGLALAQGQAGTPAPVGQYEATDLGTLGGGFSVAYGVNQAGQVVGESAIASDKESGDPVSHAFLWSDGEMIDLGTLGGDHSEALRINDAGQVVGHSTTAPGQELLDPGTHAFLWENGEMTDLGTLGSDFSRATSINEAGQVVGTSEIADGAVHPFLCWKRGR